MSSQFEAVAQGPGVTVYLGPTFFVLHTHNKPNLPLLYIDRSGTAMASISKEELLNLKVTNTYSAITCLGVLRMEKDSFLVLVQSANMVAKVGDMEICRVTGVEILSFVTAPQYNWKSVQSQSEGFDQSNTVSLPYQEMAILLESGHFYYALQGNLTLNQARQAQLSPAQLSLKEWERFDDRFFWNAFLLREFMNLQLDDWIVPLIQGHVESGIVNIDGVKVDLTVVSRRSKYRSSTRYISRGVDDDGNTANFVETEQIAITNGKATHFVQTRGSVPVFWEQQAPNFDIKKINLRSIGHEMGKSKKITLIRSPESSTLGFQSHFKKQLNLYGPQVVVDLLGSKSGEDLLSNIYQSQIQQSPFSKNIKYIHWDFHEHCKGSYNNVYNFIQQISPEIEDVGFYCKLEGINNNRYQKGIIRTNCKDCLDRTNVIQSRIALRSLHYQLREMGFLKAGSAIILDIAQVDPIFNSIWANNGDAISLLYAGTGAIKSEYVRTGQQGWKAMLDDARKSVTRTYNSGFRDLGKAEGIDQLLGNHPSIKTIPLNNSKNAEDPNAKKQITIWAGTYNLNGVLPSAHSAFGGWLKASNFAWAPDIYAIGFQEVVQLTPGTILNTDPALGAAWKEETQKRLDEMWGKGTYILFGDIQLIGLYLTLYVHSDASSHVRDIQCQYIKVALGGMTGNKGAVAISTKINNRSVVFVNGHFTAGQKKGQQRNSDYSAIMNELLFGIHKHITIDSHDFIFFVGDFNYRIDMTNEDCRTALDIAQLDQLLQYDELIRYKKGGEIFGDFHEGPITFYPTYKYDKESDLYDSSSLERVPAWTDRVLWKCKNTTAENNNDRIKLLRYERYEDDKASDHRAVRAVFHMAFGRPADGTASFPSAPNYARIHSSSIGKTSQGYQTAASSTSIDEFVLLPTDPASSSARPSSSPDDFTNQFQQSLQISDPSMPSIHQAGRSPGSSWSNQSMPVVPRHPTASSQLSNSMPVPAHQAPQSEAGPPPLPPHPSQAKQQSGFPAVPTNNNFFVDDPTFK